MANLNMLPRHLKVRILLALGPERKRYEHAAVMRMVSKEWLLAFSECPGSIVRGEWKESDLARLVVLAPSMKSIALATRGEPLILQPLSACAHLERVYIFGVMRDASADGAEVRDMFHINFSGLPDSLLKMEIRTNAPFIAHGLETFKLPNLQHLHICWRRHEHEEEIHRLINCLPGLQTLDLITTDDEEDFDDEDEEEAGYFCVTMSLPALRNLRLHCCKLKASDQRLLALQTLSLRHIVLTASDLKIVSESLPNLANLEVVGCVPVHPEEMTPLSSLRKLMLNGSTEFIRLAPDNMQQLTLQNVDQDASAALHPLESSEISVPWQSSEFSRLRSLTELKMTSSNVISPRLMRDLPLRELTLLNCTSSTFSQLCDLFVPNALTALQKLSVEDMADPELEDDQNTSRRLSSKDASQIEIEQKSKARESKRKFKAEAYISVLQKLGEAVNSLTQLQQVSGDSALFDIAMNQYLKTWRVSYAVHENYSHKFWLKSWFRV